MAELFESYIECDGECGAKITIASRCKKDASDGVLDSLAETLGWKTVDKPGKKNDCFVFCSFCQDRAKLIREGQ